MWYISSWVSYTCTSNVAYHHLPASITAVRLTRVRHRNPISFQGLIHVSYGMSADPLTYHGNTRARNAAEFLRVTEDITSSMGSMDFSFVVFHGDLDTLCDPAGSRQLFEKSAVRALAELPLHVVPCYVTPAGSLLWLM